MSPQIMRACLGPRWGVRCSCNRDIVSGSRCQDCNCAGERERNQRRGTELAFYGSAGWKKLA